MITVVCSHPTRQFYQQKHFMVLSKLIMLFDKRSSLKLFTCKAIITLFFIQHTTHSQPGRCFCTHFTPLLIWQTISRHASLPFFYGFLYFWRNVKRLAESNCFTSRWNWLLGRHAYVGSFLLQHKQPLLLLNCIQLSIIAIYVFFP